MINFEKEFNIKEALEALKLKFNKPLDLGKQYTSLFIDEGVKCGDYTSSVTLDITKLSEKNSKEIKSCGTILLNQNNIK